MLHVEGHNNKPKTLLRKLQSRLSKFRSLFLQGQMFIFLYYLLLFLIQWASKSNLKSALKLRDNFLVDFLKSAYMKVFHSGKLCKHMWVYRILNWFLCHTYSKNTASIYASLSWTWRLNLLGILWKTIISWDSVHSHLCFLGEKTKLWIFYLVLAEPWESQERWTPVLITR